MPVIRRVLIVGGGLSGLAAAGVARRRGLEALLLERQVSGAPAVAALPLHRNGVVAAEALGLELEGCGSPFSTSHIQDRRGRLLATLPGGGVAMFRHELHALLRAAADGVEVRDGVTVTRLDDRGDKVVVAMSDGEERPFDLVLGCDGARSEVRAIVYGADCPALVPSGFRAWRGVVPGDASGPIAADALVERWGPGRRIGWVPVPGGTYVWAVANQAAGALKLDWPGLAARFKGFAPPVPSLLSPPARTHLDGLDFVHLERPTWGRGRVWLLGDACHAMPLAMGQGGATALEDAVALESALDISLDPKTAWTALQTLRTERTRTLMTAAERVASVAGWSDPPSVWLRDRLVAGIPGWYSAKDLYEHATGDGLRALAQALVAPSEVSRHS